MAIARMGLYHPLQVNSQTLSVESGNYKLEIVALYYFIEISENIVPWKLPNLRYAPFCVHCVSGWVGTCCQTCRILDNNYAIDCIMYYMQPYMYNYVVVHVHVVDTCSHTCNHTMVRTVIAGSMSTHFLLLSLAFRDICLSDQVCVCKI